MGIAPVELEEKEEKGKKEGNCPMLLVNSGLFRFEEELEGNLKSLIVGCVEGESMSVSRRK